MNVYTAFINHLKSLVLKFCIKILLFFPSFSLRCSRKDQLLIKAVIILWSRISNQSDSYPGDDNYEDRIYNYAANEILGLSGSEELYEGLNYDQAKIIIDKVKQDHSNKITEAINEFKKLEKNCDSIREGMNRIFDNDKKFNLLLNETLKDCRKIKKKFGFYLKEAKKIISDRRAESYKYNINVIKMINYCCVLFPVMACIGGYLYVWLLFKLFSFNISGFFTLSDYVTSSLDKLIYPFFYSIILILFILAARVDRSRKSKQLSELHEKQDKYFIYPTAIMMLVILAFSGIVYGKMDHLFIVLGVVVIILLPYVLNRYIKASLELVTVIVLFVIYVSQVLSSSYIDYSRIINAKNNNGVIIYFDDGKVLTKKTLIFILNNSEHYFYYDKATKNIVVYPKDKVNYVINKSG